MALQVRQDLPGSRQDVLVQPDTLAALMTEDPFCAQEDIQTLESKQHHDRLGQIEGDLRMHLRERQLPYVLTGDMLIRNVPLQAGLSPDITLWPAGPMQALEAKADYKSVMLSAARCPALVLEMVSESTAVVDRETKHEIYRRAGIGEYWLYDPMEFGGGPPLQGWQLMGSAYVPIAGQPGQVGGAAVTLYPSAVLDTAWGLEGENELRLWEAARDDWYRTTAEGLQQERRQTARERSRADQERARADQEQARADQEQARADQEQARADQAEAEIARLRARLQTQSPLD